MGKLDLKLVHALCGVASALSLAACSAGGGSSSSGLPSSITVSGKLTQLSASSTLDAVQKFEHDFSTSSTQLSLDCGSSGTYTAAVDTTSGSFSANGVPTGVPCTFSFVSSSSGVVKCQVQFQDANSYDLNNNPMTTSTATVTNNVDLGSITCNTDGTITIPSSSVANVSSSASVSAATAFDFTGTYTAAPFDGTLPTGYQTVTNCSSNCHGPQLGQQISLVRFHGQKFTPNGGACTVATNTTCAVTDGTVDSTVDGFGMSIWGGDYAHGIGACGANTGFTAAEARAFAHISLDSTQPSLEGHALNYAHYTWSTPSGFGTDNGWTKPWMYGGARAQYDIADCQPVSIPSTSGGQPKAGWGCFSQTQSNSGPTGIFVWNVGLQNSGGCVDGSGNPIMVNNWGSLTGSCTSSASTFNSHMQTNSCTYTGAATVGGPSTTFTCSFTGGMFNDISGSTGSTNDNGPNMSNPYTMPMGNWGGQPTTIIHATDLCGSSAAGHTEANLLSAAGGAASAAQAQAAKELLMRYQCYANQYWQHKQDGAGTISCARDYNFNWSTNNYANFVIGDDRSMKPQNAFITDRVFYSPDGQWAFLKNVDTRYRSMPTVNGSTLCPMAQTVELKVKRISDTKLMVDFTQTNQVTDNSATCQGAVAAAIAGGGTLASDPQGLNGLYQDLQTQHFIFYLNK